MTKPLNLLIHDYAGHPFQIQISKELARRGYKVRHLYYALNNTPKGNLRVNDNFCGDLLVEGIYTKRPAQKYSYLQRWRQDLEYGCIVKKKVREYKPDVIISANTPLDAQRKIASGCRKVGAKFVFWLQDLSGLAAKELLEEKIPLIGKFIGGYYQRLERRLLRRSDRLIVIANDFKTKLINWKIPERKIDVIQNWAPLNELPVRPKNNSWAFEHGILDNFCFLYTGGLGLKHNPNLLLQLAISFKKEKNVKVVVVSEGPGAIWLREKSKELGLENLNIHKYQPFEHVPNVLASGDVLIAILEPEAGLFSVPSKVLTYLCAQRPLLLAIPENNLAAQIVSDNQAGIVVNPNEVGLFIEGAKRLFFDRDYRTLLGRNARRYAEKKFDISEIGDRFEKLIVEVMD